jgi:hypothetical protein
MAEPERPETPHEIVHRLRENVANSACHDNCDCGSGWCLQLLAADEIQRLVRDIEQSRGTFKYIPT